MTEEERLSHHREINVCATLGCGNELKLGYPHCKDHILYWDKATCNGCSVELDDDNIYGLCVGCYNEQNGG